MKMQQFTEANKRLSDATPVHPMRSRRRRGSAMATLTAAAVFGAMPLVQSGTARAASGTWTGAIDGTWGNASNWQGGVPSASTDDATFYATGAGNLTGIDLQSNRSIRTLNFNTTATSPVTLITGNNIVNAANVLRQLTINGASNSNDVDVEAGSHLIKGDGGTTTGAFDVKLGNPTGGFNFNVASGGSLEISARINGSSSSTIYNKTGAGLLLLDGPNGGTGGWNFSGGGFNVTGGTLTLGTTSAVGNSGDKFIASGTGAVELKSTGSYFSNASGGFTINDGGTLRETAATATIGNGTSTGTVAVSGNSIIDVQGTTLTMSHRLSGSGALSKIGTGTLVLNDAQAGASGNTFNGTLSIAAGTVKVNNSVAIPASALLVGSGATLDVSPVTAGFAVTNQTLGGAGTVVGATTLAGGGIMAPGGAATAGTLSFSNDLTLSAGTLSVDLSNTPGTVGGGVNDLLAVTGNLNLSGSTVLAVNRLNGNIGPGTYTLATYTGALAGGAANVVLPMARQSLSLDTSTAGQINLVVGTPASAALVWAGDGATNSWDKNTTANWLNGASADKFFDWDDVSFTDAGSNSPNIVLSSANGPLVPNSITVNATKNYTFTGTGVFNSVNSLTKSGTGNLTLGSADGSSFVAVAVNGGKLTVANTNAIGSLTVGAAGTLSIGDGVTAGDGVVSTPITNNGIVQYNRPDDVAIATVISGSGSVTKLNANTVTLSAVNTYTGNTNVNAGTLKVSNNGALGATTGGNVNVASGATVDIGGITAANSATFGSRVFHIQGTGASGAAGALANSATVQQNAAFNFITLDGDATIGGSRLDIGRNVPNGILDLQGHTLSTNTTGTANTVFGILDTVTVTSGQIVVTGGGLDLERGAIVHADLSGSAITFNSGTNLQTFQGTAGSVTRPVVLKGSNVIGSGSTTVGEIDSPMTLQGNVSIEAMGGGVISATANNPLILGGNIGESGGSFSVTKLGASTATLAGSNTYSGGTIISAGTVATGSAGALGAGAVEVDSGAFLDLNGNTPAVVALSSTGTGTIGNSSTTANATLNYTGAAINPSTFSGVIQDVVGTGTQKSALTVSSGSLTLAAANTYTGNTTVNAGAALVLASTGSIGAAGNVTVNGSLTSNQTSQTIASLNGSAGGSLLLNGTTLTVSNGGTFSADWNDGTAASTITNSGGTLALNGATAPGGTVNANAPVTFAGNATNSTVTRSLSALNIAGGVAVAITHGIPLTPTVLKVANTNFGIGSTLDISDNAFITTGTAAGALTQIQSGQIFSSETADTSHAIGYVNLGGADTGKYEVRYTLKGDSNLDGTVNVGDLGALATNYNITGGMSWANGDFNQDGTVNVADLGALATNYNNSLATVASAGGGGAASSLIAAPSAVVAGGAAAVPEPATLSLLGIGALALLGRRTRKQK